MQEVTSAPTIPVDNVITTKGLQDRSINILDGTTVENKGKLVLDTINNFVNKKLNNGGNREISQYNSIRF